MVATGLRARGCADGDGAPELTAWQVSCPTFVAETKWEFAGRLRRIGRRSDWNFIGNKQAAHLHIGAISNTKLKHDINNSDPVQRLDSMVATGLRARGCADGDGAPELTAWQVQSWTDHNWRGGLYRGCF
ncbi:beta-galactosidase 2 [Phtheirospermum japonicum]|uniref:Beta-galactosidase 2 n=1 Tax=Phtheirospermum japonicum TaxID=374723 RepID=A0A830CD76_9LAMI|nr:beta-galactosidase 2 [Phtheirospermum japonicum]